MGDGNKFMNLKSEAGQAREKAYVVSELMVEHAFAVSEMFVKHSKKGTHVPSISEMEHALDLTKFVFRTYISKEEIELMIKDKSSIMIEQVDIKE